MSIISLEDLKKEEKNLERKLSVVRLMINAYSDDSQVPVKKDYEKHIIDGKEYITINSSNNVNEIDENFPKDAKWLDQMLFLIELKNRFMGNTEIAELLMNYYPDMNVDKLKRKVSVTISAAYKSGKHRDLIKTSVGNRPKDIVWGFDKWQDEEGNIGKDHKPYGKW